MRNKKGAFKKKQVVIEQLEARVMYSADSVLGNLLHPNLEDDADDVLYAYETRSSDDGDKTRTAELSNEAPFPEQSAQLILVDAAVVDYQLLIDALVSDHSYLEFKILTLHSGNSGIAQLTEALNGEFQYAAIHLISHGIDGSIQLGTDTITLDSIDEYSRELQLWRHGLTPDADFFIYGCEVAGTPDGESLVTEIGRLTQADVAASTDKTGNQESGADWELEHTSGVIDTQPLFLQTEPDWMGLLATNDAIDVSSGVELNVDGGNDSYLISQSGLSQNLTQMTLEIRFEADQASMGAEPTLISYNNGAEDVLTINYNQPAIGLELDFGVGALHYATGVDYLAELFDGSIHTLSVTWDNTIGYWSIYIDGVLVDSDDGLAVGETLNTTAGQFVFGNEQDGGNSGYVVPQRFAGTYYDVRIWNEVRSDIEIASGYRLNVDPNNPPAELIANWQMDGFNASNEVVNIVGNNNLTIAHASGPGFTLSTPVGDLHVVEGASSGTRVGFVQAAVSDTPDDLIVDGKFLEVTPAPTGIPGDPNEYITLVGAQTFGGWMLNSGSIDITVAEAAPGANGSLIIDLSGNDPGTITGTSFDTDPGEIYEVRFAINGNFTGGDMNTKDMRVLIDGVGYDFSVDHKGSDWANRHWEYHTVSFVAGANSSVGFASLESNAFGALLADVRVTKVSDSIGDVLATDPALTYDATSGKFYKAFEGDFKWIEARGLAQTETLNGVSGDLVTINSPQENAIVAGIANAMATPEDIWIGASDKNSEGNWFWHKNGAQDNDQKFWVGDSSGSVQHGFYSNWNSAEPSAVGDTVEDYARMDFTTGEWRDTLNDSLHSFVVEWDAAQVLNSFTFALTDDADGRFTIDSYTGEITVYDGLQLDYEKNQSHDVTVQVTNTAGLSYSEVMTILVDDIDELEITAPATSVTDEDTMFVYSGANIIEVTDTLAGDNILQLSLEVNNGTLDLASITGITFIAGSDGSASMIIEGLESDLNAALNGLEYNPDPNYNGSDTLRVATSVAADLEARYTFEDNNANDQSPAATHDGSFVGGAATTTFGERGVVAVLDGVDDQIDISGSFGDPADLTLASWVNIDNAATGTGKIFEIGFVGLLQYNSNSGYLEAGSHDGTQWNFNRAPVDLVGQGWNHVAYTWNESTSTGDLYLNGVVLATTTSVTPVTATALGTAKVGSAISDIQYFNGLLDDARIYSRALSAAEVSSIVNEISASVAITVNPDNDAPTTTPVVLAPIVEDSSTRTITQAQLLANAGDIDGDALSATGLAISVGNGSLADNGDGTWGYTPAADDDTDVSFTYIVTDGNINVATTATLDITPDNDAPVTAFVTITAILEDSGARTITQAELLSNASDVEGDSLTANSLSIATGNGSLVDNGDGTWDYTPATDDDSNVSFNYIVTDGNSNVAGTVGLDIIPDNDPPTTTPVTLTSIVEDSGIRTVTQAELLVNANDVEGDTLTATGLSISAGNGTLVDNGDGTWDYTPATDDDGDVSFAYTVTDGNSNVAGTATLDITSDNDAPTTTPVTLTQIVEDSGVRTVTQSELLVNATDIEGDPLTATGLNIATGSGSLVDNGDGTWDYTPASDDDTNVSFNYTISDGTTSVAGSATLDIIPDNDPPVTTPVTLTSIIEDNGSRVITQAELLSNATDIEGDTLTATGLSISTGSGSLVDNGDGTWDYTPAGDDDTDVSFTYSVTDGNSNIAGTATLDITPDNDTPTTTPVILTPIAEDSGTRTVTQAELLANATDVEGDSLTATGLSIASGSGSLVDNGDGTWDYTPDSNDDTDVSFTYSVTDGNSNVAGSATLDITPDNDAPTTTPVTLTSIVEDSGTRMVTQAELLANATDVEGDALTATGLSIATGSGSLVDNGDGTWDYTPASNDDSDVSFTYSVTDGNSNVAGSATLDITPDNDPPTTTPVTLTSIVEDSGTRTVTQAELLANATDIEGDALTAIGLSIASGSGSIVDNGDGTWDYTPASDDDTNVSFSYSVTDGNSNVAGTATLDIIPDNDPPTTTPVALTSIVEDSGARTITQAELIANASDIEGDALTAAGLSIATGNGSLTDNGDGTWDYTPASDDDTDVSFTYLVTDGNSNVSGTATLDITPDNDAPTTTPVTLTSILEDSGTRTITQAELLATASDTEGDTLTATGLTIATGNGALIDNGDGTWGYTPASDDDTDVSFAFTVTDGNSNVGSTATLDIIPDNDAPTTSTVTLTQIVEDSGVRTITQAELLVNATDVEGDALTATGLAISAGNGALTDNGDGTWDYTPAGDDDTDVTFTYLVTDGNSNVAGTAALDITPDNDTPTTAPVTLVPIVEDSGIRTVTQAELLANATDVEADALTATNLTIATGTGTLTDNGDGTWDYTPASDDDTNVTFTYAVSDGNSNAAGTATLDITPDNDAPTTTPVTLAPIVEDSGARIITQSELLANSTDIEGDALTATGLSIATGNGSLVNNGDGTWNYTPASNDDADVSFTYAVTDGTSNVAGTTTLDIIPDNDAPTTTSVTLTPIAEDSGARTITQSELLVNAVDIEGDSLTATGLIISTGGGALVDNGDGTWDFTPASDDDTDVSFTYTVTDGNGNAAGTATLDITPDNDAPATAPVTLTPIAEDSGARTITQPQLLANASDVEGDALTATGLVISAGNGTLTDNGDGTWDYTPASSDDTDVSFTYTVSDGTNNVAGVATLDILEDNDTPTSTPVTLIPIVEDSTARTITQADLLVNANDIEGDPLTATGLVIDTGYGALVDNGDGTWDYTPAGNDDTGVSFTYLITDNNSNVAATATLDITPDNDAPTSTTVILTPIAEDSGARIVTQAELLANASDIEGDVLTATGLTIATGSGTLVDNGDGTWNYTASSDDDTDVTFAYAVTDGNSNVAGTATLDITPDDDAPITSAVTLTPIVEDNGVTITQTDLLANASDIEGDTLTAIGMTIGSGGGTLLDNGDGTWDYMPASDDDTDVSFNYTVTDGSNNVAGVATLDITPDNDAPTTSTVTITPIVEDSGARMITQSELLAIASDIEGDALTATGLTISAGSGALIDNGDGTWDYTPASNDDLDVAFTYAVTDGNSNVAGTATLDITPDNDAPTNTPVALAPIIEDSGSRTVTQAELLANATDIEGDVLTATGLVIDTGNGTLADNGDGTWDYTPASSDDTNVSFTYTVTDGNSNVSGSATLDITPDNDAPTTTAVTLAPIVEDSAARTITQAELLINATDIEGDTLTATGLSIATGSGALIDNGDGTWAYTPAGDDDTAVTFTYSVTDGVSNVAGTATLDITPDNDAPNTTSITLSSIVEDSGSRTITQAELLANAIDVEGDALTASGLLVDTGSGTLFDNGDGTWDYTPASEDDTDVTFSYVVTDGNSNVAGAASLDITPDNDVPNTTPVILAPIVEDSGIRTLTQAELLANASDVEGDALTATNLTIATGTGTLIDNGDGSWDYTPSIDDDSSVTFTYAVTDGNSNAAGIATLDITPDDDAPTTTPVTLLPVAEDSGSRTITQAELLVNATDIEGDTLTATGLLITSGTGTLTDNGDGTWGYTPSADDDTDVSFAYTISDNNNAAVASATLDITPDNDPPITTPITLASIAEDSIGVTITQSDLLANASDIEGDALTAIGLNIASGSGSLIDNGDGTWEYTSAGNDDTNVSFTYTVTDGSNNVAGIAILDITPVNDAPDTTPVALTPIVEDSGARTITQAVLLANASDIEGDVLTASGLSVATGNGLLVDNGDGTWDYTPDSDDDTAVSFLYTVTDGANNIAGNASLDITPDNDAPVTTQVTLTPIAEDSGPRTITQAELLANTVDIEGNALLAVGLVLSAGSGSLVDNGDGTWVYTPIGNDDTGVSFNYSVTDGNTSVAGTAILDITADNDAPTTSTIALTPVVEDSGLRKITQSELLANANDIEGDVLVASGLVISTGSGTLIDNGDGTWDYSQANDDDTSVSFAYTVSDGISDISGAAILDIVPDNDAPTAASVVLSPIDEDGGSRSITQTELLANASDVEGDDLTASGLTILSGNGSLTDNLDGTWDYTPASDDDTDVSFAYTVTDGDNTVAGLAMLDITPINDAPTTIPVTLAPILEDNGRTITQAELLANADDIDNSLLAATSLSVTSGSGTVVDNGDGTWDFTPIPNDDSMVSFSYAIEDGLTFVSALATLDIIPVNDAPIGLNNTVVTPEDTPYFFNVSDFGFVDENENDTFENVVISAIPDDGQLTLDFIVVEAGDVVSVQHIAESKLMYVPPPNSIGQVADLGFRVQDSGGVENNGSNLDSQSRLMVIETSAINDEPDIVTGEVKVGEGGDIVITPSMLAATDIDNLPEELIFTITQVSSHGQLFLNGVQLDTNDQFSMQQVIDNRLRYFHDGSITEADFFDVSLVDGVSTGSSPATVNIVIEPLMEPAMLVIDNLTPGPTREPEQTEEIETVENQVVTEIFDGVELQIPELGSRSTDEDVGFDVVIPAPVVSLTDDVDFLYGDELLRIEVKQHNKFATANYDAELNALSANVNELSVDFGANAKRTIDNANFQQGLANLSDDLDSAEDEANKKYEIQGDLGLGVSISVTAGILAWVLRGGSLLATALASTPLWGQLDPVKVITGTKEEDETQSEDNVEEIFRNSN